MELGLDSRRCQLSFSTLWQLWAGTSKIPRRIKHWHVRRVATASHCTSQICTHVASTLCRISRMRGESSNRFIDAIIVEFFSMHLFFTESSKKIKTKVKDWRKQPLRWMRHALYLYEKHFEWAFGLCNDSRRTTDGQVSELSFTNMSDMKIGTILVGGWHH